MLRPELLNCVVQQLNGSHRIITTRMQRMAFKQTTACKAECFKKRIFCKGRYGIIGACGDKTAVRAQNGGYQNLVTAYKNYGSPVYPTARFDI